MASDKTKPKSASYQKNEPTIFPLGLAVRRVGKEAVVIDFLDNSSDNAVIISSIAMLREQAIGLAEGILGAFNDGENDTD